MQWQEILIFEYMDAIKLLAAVVTGGFIGAERERFKKAVGLRTIILISVGSCLFTILSPRLGHNDYSARIAANIVVGIGFLGAGVIMQEGGRIVGLTTSATIWLAAALGMACGAGEFILSAISAVIGILILMPLTKVEDLLEISSEDRTYEIRCKISWDKYKKLKSLFKDGGLLINRYKQEKKGQDMICTFEVTGPTKKHDKVVQKIFQDKDIKECWF